MITPVPGPGERVDLIVKGLPAPQGSKSYKGLRGGKPVLVESSARVKPWRHAVHVEAEATGIIAPRGAQVSADILFRLPRPRSHYGTGRNSHLLRSSAHILPVTAPDIDKLARATLDALTTGGLIRDDAQVTRLHLSKVYAPTGVDTGAVILVHSERWERRPA